MTRCVIASGGLAKDATLKVASGGVVKPVQRGVIASGGIAKEFYSAAENKIVWTTTLADANRGGTASLIELGFTIFGNGTSDWRHISTSGPTTTLPEDWHADQPITPDANFEVFVTRVSGNFLTVGTVDTWLSLDTADRDWYYRRNSTGVSQGTFDCSIRQIDFPGSEVTKRITMRLEKF